MATIIDQLVVELGLDPTKFSVGLQNALNNLAKGTQQIEKQTSNLEQKLRALGETISDKLTSNFLRFGAALLGARGLIEFIENITKANQELGFNAKILGTTVENLSAWQNAAKIAGGSAESLSGFFLNLNTDLNNLTITGHSSVIPYLRSLGVNAFDAGGKVRDSGDILLDIADAIEKRTADPGRAAAFLRGMGLDQDMINIVLQGKQALLAYREEAQRLFPQTQRNTENARQLARAWSEITVAVNGLGAAFANLVTPSIVAAINWMTARIEKLFTIAKGVFWGGLAGSFIPGIGTIAGSIAGGTAAAILGSADEDKRIDELVKGGIPRKTAELTIKGKTGKTTPLSIPVGGPGATRGLSLKPGATGGGGVELGTLALASVLQSGVPEFNRITSLNDDYHKGMKSQHNKGLALDFTIAGNSREQAAVIAAQLRTKLGSGVTVLDEYNNPSPGATGGHIHVQFNSAAAAKQFELGAGAAFVPSGARGGGGNTTVNIGAVNITSQATDATGIASEIRGAIRAQLQRSGNIVAQSNSGQ